MKCPFCQSTDTQVIETRDVEDGTALRRRRRCGDCDKRFTTYERAEVSFPVVVKKDGRRTDYDRDKLRASFLLALRKRPVSADAVDTAIGRVEQLLLQSGARELPSTQIGAWVMDELRTLDGIAYVRFASVYHSFKDLSQFIDVLQEMQPAQAPSPTRGRRRKPAA